MTTFSEVDRLIRELIASPRTNEEVDRWLTRSHMALISAQEAAIGQPPPDRDRVPPPDDGQSPPPPRRRPPGLPRRRIQAPSSYGDGLMVNWDGKTPVFKLEDVVLLGGYRSCLIGLIRTTHKTRLEIENVEFKSADDDVGTYWAGNLYGIEGGYIRDVDVDGLYGHDLNEGHVFYFTLSLSKGQELLLERVNVNDTGGHFLHFVSSLEKGREGSAPLPGDEPGTVTVRDCVVHDTDMSPARGAFSLSFSNCAANVAIERCEVMQTSQRKGQSGFYNANSRGLLLLIGRMGNATVSDSTFVAESPSDRYAQWMVEGPPVATFVRTRMDGQVFAVNHPYGDNADTVKTKRLVLNECRGSAVLEIAGKTIGKLDDMKSGEWEL